MNKLLIICGPTATGKTDMAAAIAKKLDGELVSADSRQVYVGMDIGTGKDKKQLTDVPIWMYDVVRPDEQYSVTIYRKNAICAIKDIRSRGKLPIVTGGTGFYIDAIIAPRETFEIKPDRILRDALASKTVIQLQETLRNTDKEIFDNLNNSDRNNPRRLVRKIEIATSNKLADRTTTSEAEIDIKHIGLTAPQKDLYARIDNRVDERMKLGIIAEITLLIKKGYTWDLPSMSGLGYREWRLFFESNVNKADVINQWKIDEDWYAKRQLTWFKKNPRIEWHDVTDPDVYKNVTSSVFSWYTRSKE